MWSLIIWQLVASNLLIFPRIEAAEMSYRYFFVINSVLGLSNLFLRPCIVWMMSIVSWRQISLLGMETEQHFVNRGSCVPKNNGVIEFSMVPVLGRWTTNNNLNNHTNYVANKNVIKIVLICQNGHVNSRDAQCLLYTSLNSGSC